MIIATAQVARWRPRVPKYGRAVRMNDVGIFVSHSSKYVDIANSLKLSLHALEAETPLAIKIS